MASELTKFYICHDTIDIFVEQMCYLQRLFVSNISFAGTSQHDCLAKTCSCGTYFSRSRWTSTRRCSISGRPRVQKTHRTRHPNEATTPSNHPRGQEVVKAGWGPPCRTCWTVLGAAFPPATIFLSRSRLCPEQTSLEGSFNSP